MRTQVTRRIRWEGGFLTLASGRSRYVSSAMSNTVKVPRCREYRVTYKVSPWGTLLAHNPLVNRLKANSLDEGFLVCFLPREWKRVRVTRTVKVIR